MILLRIYYMLGVSKTIRDASLLLYYSILQQLIEHVIETGVLLKVVDRRFHRRIPIKAKVGQGTVQRFAIVEKELVNDLFGHLVVVVVVRFVGDDAVLLGPARRDQGSGGDRHWFDHGRRDARDATVRHGRHGVKVGFLVGTAGGLEAGALDLGAAHVLGEVGLAPEKELIVIRTGVFSPSETLESVEIQLTLEAREFGLTKVSVV